MYGGGIGGYTGGGYQGWDNESESNRSRGQGGWSGYGGSNYGRGESGEQNRGYNEGYGTRGRSDYERGGREDDRGFFEKIGDEVSSWFGGEDDNRDRSRQSHRGRGPRNYTRSDDRIKEDVNDRLTDSHFIDASDVDVEVNEGIVILSGSVESRYAKRMAEDIAEQVTGVKDVENRIRVNREQGQSTSTSSGLGGYGGSTTGAASTGTPTTGSSATGTTGTSGTTGSTGTTGATGTSGTTGTGSTGSQGTLNVAGTSSAVDTGTSKNKSRGKGAGS
jgi:osmotically-inducible protein OsmY